VAELSRNFQKRQLPATGPQEPIAVTPPWSSLILYVPSFLGFLVDAGLVLVLLLFMLIAHRDLRDRLFRLVGYGRVTVTTKALDEAGQRISRALRMQAVVNGTYGSAVGLGLFCLGVPYALMWGLFAGMLRFIPYIGPAVGALMPIALSMAVFAGWVKPLLVGGLFVLLEIATNALLEPLLYSRGAGVSQVAILMSIAFWAWLWGPVGLLLATPLTVCLGVLGKYVPYLTFLEVLLSDEPATELNRYYQRLVARDQDGATEIVEDLLEVVSNKAQLKNIRITEEQFLKAIVASERALEGKFPYQDEESERQFLEAFREGILRRLFPKDKGMGLGAMRSWLVQYADFGGASHAGRHTNEERAKQDAGDYLMRLVKHLGMHASSEAIAGRNRKYVKSATELVERMHYLLSDDMVWRAYLEYKEFEHKWSPIFHPFPLEMSIGTMRVIPTPEPEPP